MNYRVIITSRALADLTAIRDYIAKQSPANSAKFLQKVLAQFDVLEFSPESFATAPEDDSVPYTLRQVIVKPYRILYAVNGSRVEILHIRHGARLPASPDELG
jgi:plasmid stabilization system protein ParE